MAEEINSIKKYRFIIALLVTGSIILFLSGIGVSANSQAAEDINKFLESLNRKSIRIFRNRSKRSQKKKPLYSFN